MSGLLSSAVRDLGWKLLLVLHTLSVAQSQELSANSLRRVESRNLPNAIWVHPTVMSGGLPVGKSAFEELARLGIKTVVSVDGIKPDVDGAASAGLRYVHLPHGYDGISEERLMHIARAVRDLPGPIYIHCHHGRHRSPAASAAACISLGRISPAQGAELLRLAGTNPGFRGLLRAVERAAPITDDRLDQLQVDFVPCSDLPPIVDTMVEIDAIMERLKDFRDHGWEPSCRIEAASEALMLKEHYIELQRSESGNSRERGFVELLEEGGRLAEHLESILQRDVSVSSAENTVVADRIIKQLINNCSDCHGRYRDNR